MSEVVGMRACHPSVALVVELMLSTDASPVVVVMQAILLLADRFWFRSLFIVALA